VVAGKIGSEKGSRIWVARGEASLLAADSSASSAEPTAPSAVNLHGIASGEKWQEYLRHALMHSVADRRSHPDHHTFVADHGARLTQRE
jgi:hypothetical protein